jgi:hypothetical protein
VAKKYDQCVVMYGHFRCDNDHEPWMEWISDSWNIAMFDKKTQW